MQLNTFHELVDRLRASDRVIIQPHDFPDHDAIASTFAMGYLLKQLGLNPVLVYKGEIDRISLQNMIDFLNIPMRLVDEINLTPHDKIITMDSCIGENNITDLPGLEIAVIDHHQVTPPDFVWYSDIRPKYGACSTIVVEYFELMGVPISKKVATALLVGINIDTANFTRGVSPADTEALIKLRKIADTHIVNKICRNQILFQELDYYFKLLKGIKREGKVGWAMLPKSCPKNLLGVLSDFVLSIHEIDVVILAAQRDNGIQLSLRSECLNNNVGELAKKVLNHTQIGYGGGHWHMAAGIVCSPHHLPLKDAPDDLFSMFKEKIVY